VKKLQAQRFLRKICAEFDTKVRFQHKLKLHTGQTIHGLMYSNHKKRIIYINKNIPIRHIASAVFHELGHVYCITNGIWQRFHTHQNTSSAIAFKVENWIEWWAKGEWDARGMRKIFGHYSFSYLKSNKKQITQWLKKNYDLN
jgi:hypothetical protein